MAISAALADKLGRKGLVVDHRHFGVAPGVLLEVADSTTVDMTVAAAGGGLGAALIYAAESATVAAAVGSVGVAVLAASGVAACAIGFGFFIAGVANALQ